MKPALLLLLAATAHAQFSAAFLQDEKYWGDGNAEFNIYDAEMVRYGQSRKCEVVHILVREPFSDRELVKAEPNTRSGTYPVIKLNQILHIPTGLYVYQQMHSAFWRCDNGALIKATLTSNDSCGNTYKEFRALGGLRGLFDNGWRYEWRTYWEGMSAGEENVNAPRGAIFADELPLRVRMIDFKVGAGHFNVDLAPTIITSKKDNVQFERREFRFRTEGDRIEVTVGRRVRPPPHVIIHEGIPRVVTDDVFVLDAAPPYRLREWSKPDGTLLKLRRSLRIDYWNYNKLGDKERALALP